MTPNSGVSLRGENVCVCVQTSTDSLRGKYSLVLNCGEKPKEPMPTKLSDILEKNVDSRYALSPKACQGILNRAKRRGKELPEALEMALRMQSVSKNEQENRGGGKGILIQNEHTGALSTLNNQSVFCLQENGIDRADTAGCNGKGWKEDVSYTLNTIDRPAVVALNDQGVSVMNVSTEVTSALRAEEHGHQPIVQQPIMVEMTSTKNTIIEDGISTTLTARMGTGGNQVNAVCFQNTGQGWWNESEVGATVRTPCGGDSMKANLVLHDIPDGDRDT